MLTKWLSVLSAARLKVAFTVDVRGLRAFLPGSLVDVRPLREITHLENIELEFKVIKLDPKRNNVVVSRRAVMESANSVEREELLANLEEGASLKGVIKNLTDYGAFVDLGGIDGLLHITDMSWKRIKHPSEMINVGDEIDVKVLKFDRERNRVSLGMKQMGEDPWGDIKGRYPEGARAKAKITNLTDYGCFAELEDGVEGLVHVSEMDWTNKNVHPSKIVDLGHEVEVMVLDIDEERRRISLGIKQCSHQPMGRLCSPLWPKATRSQARSNPSLTSVSLSVWMVALTVWFTCLISLGTKLAKKLFATSRKAKKLRQLYSALMQSASASLWVSSSFLTIRLTTT